MPPRRRQNGSDPGVVRFAGNDWPVLDELMIGRRTYQILEELGTGDRQRFMAFDRYAGVGGDLRAILVLPNAAASRQLVRVLRGRPASNFPVILDSQRRGDQLSLVLPWIRGCDLKCYLDDVRAGKKARPSAVESFRLARGLAHAVTKLHRRCPAIHADLKPANLILTPSPSSRLVMIDFGSAFSAERTIMRYEGDGATAGYGAPELQTGASRVDHRADQFSVSVVLYEMLTLKLPYDGLGGKAGRPQFAERMASKLVLPSRVSPDRNRLPSSVWRGIDQLVQTGLQFDPDERFPTPDAWLDELNAVQSDIHRRSRLSPVNAVLTRVTSWIDERLNRR